MLEVLKHDDLVLVFTLDFVPDNSPSEAHPMMAKLMNMIGINFEILLSIRFEFRFYIMSRACVGNQIFCINLTCLSL